MNGKVKFFNEMKGFGFIEAEDGKEYFVHQTGLNEGTNIRENDSVSFDVTEGDRGPKAVNVSLGSGDASNDDAADDSEEMPENNEDKE